MKIYKLFFVFVLFFGIVQIEAQSDEAKKFYEQGKVDYYDDNNSSAISNFKKALEEEEDWDDALYYLAMTYYYESQYSNADKGFKTLLDKHPNYKNSSNYYWGKTNLRLGNIETAASKFEQYLVNYNFQSAEASKIHYAKWMLDYCQKSLELRKQGNTMKDPVNMGSEINSISGDYKPAINPTGKILYFTSERKGGFDDPDAVDPEDNDWGEDIYYVMKEGDKWGKPILLPEPINSYANEGAASFSGDGQIMVYSGCNREDGVGECDIYIATLEGSTWSKPVNMGNVVNSEAWESHPIISADGTSIIFVSDREGGYGGKDLYISKINKFKDWGFPVNLGDVINTPEDEYSPFLSSDGKTLYFSSDGHPGFGEQDLFMSVYVEGKWSEPVNLGKPLNSEKDDMFFSIGGAGEIGYYASDRDGTIGDQDLFTIEIPEAMRPQPTVVISGVVSNAKTKEPAGAWVLIEDINTEEMISISKSNSETGKYLIVLPSGRNYSVSANKKGYFFYSQLFEVPEEIKYTEIVKNIELKPIEKGAKIVLNNIFFETGKAELSSESRLELEKAVDLMKANPSMVIEVGGHTDNVGNDENNIKLSHQRAKSVRQYLVTAGIASKRVQAKGYGETTPIADNETKEGKAANRRTEFIILEF